MKYTDVPVPPIGMSVSSALSQVLTVPKLTHRLSKIGFVKFY